MVLAERHPLGTTKGEGTGEDARDGRKENGTTTHDELPVILERLPRMEAAKAHHRIWPVTCPEEIAPVAANRNASLGRYLIPTS